MASRSEMPAAAIARASEANLDDDQRSPQPAFLADADASRFQRNMGLTVGVIAAICFAVATPFAKIKLGENSGFIPAYEAALFVGDLVTAVLLFGQFTKLRTPALLVLAAGFLFDALIVIPHALSFPGGFGPAGVIGGGPQTTAWVYIAWHGFFPLFVIAYALLKDRGAPLPQAPGVIASRALLACAAVALLVIAVTLAVTVGHDALLPPIMVGNTKNPVSTYFLGGAWAVSVLALLVLWYVGIRSVLDVWVAATMWVWTFDIALSAVLNAGRFDVGFYAGRGFGLLSAGFVLVVLLLETSGLLNRLVERTAELSSEALRLKGQMRETEAQLRQSQKMEAIGNLTGGMAHDFNNLLAVVIGNLDVLVDARKDDPQMQALASEALDAALNGADLTRRLLAFARRQPLQPRLVDLNDLVSEHTKLLRRLLGERIEVVLDLAPDLSRVVVDPTQLESALTNLAANARDAMPRGGRLKIATSNRRLDADYADAFPDVAAGDYAAIEVSDTGSGIPPEIAERIFEPFFSTKEVGKGTGLGLSMVYGFMKQSKGHVNVYSEMGFGTTFRLYLPVAGADQRAEPRPLAAEREARGNGETVLVVEDVASLRKVVVRQLGELGYRPLEADGAATALAILEREPVDVLFTDIIIGGGVTGFDLAATARSRWPNLRVLFTSGFPDSELAVAERAAAGRLLSKPVRKTELANALQELLRRSIAA